MRRAAVCLTLAGSLGNIARVNCAKRNFEGEVPETDLEQEGPPQGITQRRAFTSAHSGFGMQRKLPATKQAASYRSLCIAALSMRPTSAVNPV